MQTVWDYQNTYIICISCKSILKVLDVQQQQQQQLRQFEKSGILGFVHFLRLAHPVFGEVIKSSASGDHNAIMSLVRGHYIILHYPFWGSFWGISLWIVHCLGWYYYNPCWWLFVSFRGWTTTQFMEDYKKTTKKDPGINHSVLYRKQDCFFQCSRARLDQHGTAYWINWCLGVIFANDHWQWSKLLRVEPDRQTNSSVPMFWTIKVCFFAKTVSAAKSGKANRKSNPFTSFYIHLLSCN